MRLFFIFGVRVRGFLDYGCCLLVEGVGSTGFIIWICGLEYVWVGHFGSFCSLICYYSTTFIVIKVNARKIRSDHLFHLFNEKSDQKDFFYFYV